MKKRPGTPTITPDQADALTAALTALATSIECLCSNVSALRSDLATHSATLTAHGSALALDAEQSKLMRARISGLVHQLDGFERYLLAVDPRYPKDRHGGHTPLAPVNGRTH